MSLTSGRECVIASEGDLLVGGEALDLHNSSLYNFDYNVVPFDIPGMLTNIRVGHNFDSADNKVKQYLTCGPLWALAANHIKYRAARATYVQPMRHLMKNAARQFAPLQDISLIFISAGIFSFVKHALILSPAVYTLEVGSVVGAGIPALKPFKFLEAFTIDVWAVLCGTIVILGFVTTLKFSHSHGGRLVFVRSPLLVMFQIGGFLLGESQWSLTQRRHTSVLGGSGRRGLRRGVVGLLLITFTVLMNAFQGSLWTLMGLAYRPLVVDSVWDLLRPEYADWLVFTSEYLPAIHYLRDPALGQQQISWELWQQDRLFFMDWEEILKQAVHLWGGLFVAFSSCFALLPRRFIIHTIWLSSSVAPSQGIEKSLVDDAIAGLHISPPLAVEPWFISFNLALDQKVKKSYGLIFTLYFQSGLMKHWFTEESDALDHLITESESGGRRGERDFAPLKPRDFAGACSVLVMGYVAAALLQGGEYLIQNIKSRTGCWRMFGKSSIPIIPSIIVESF